MQINKFNFSLSREFIAGVTTFFTMAYVIVVNPLILAPTGMGPGALFVATCLSAALGCFLMATFANLPIALAPTMGMNAYFAYVVINLDGFSWEYALGAVFIAGILFLLLTFTGIRQWLIYRIPDSLKIAISVGIGLFLAVIALRNLQILIYDQGVDIIPHFNLKVFLTLPVMLCFGGLLIMILLSFLRVTGAILIGMLAITTASVLFHLIRIQHFISLPPSLLPILLKLKFPSHWDIHIFGVTLTFLFVILLDNTGTTIAVLQQGGLLENKKYQKRIGRALLADSLANIGGSLLGSSPTGSYIESIAGVEAGGKSGMVAIVVGILFLAALFFSPFAAAIPNYAAAAALLFVAGLMCQSLKFIPWRNITEVIPALITFITIPFTFSIADGLSAAFISYVLVKCLFGKINELNKGLWILAGLCVVMNGYKILSF